MKITRFEDLECWQEARELVSAVYGTTMNGNFKKDLRLSGQIQAAATSVMANVAEDFVYSVSIRWDVVRRGSAESSVRSFGSKIH